MGHNEILEVLFQFIWPVLYSRFHHILVYANIWNSEISKWKFLKYHLELLRDFVYPASKQNELSRMPLFILPSQFSVILSLYCHRSLYINIMARLLVYLIILIVSCSSSISCILLQGKMN